MTATSAGSDLADAPDVAPGALPRLTVAKAVSNTALRWVPPFLPTLEVAFGASTTQLTTILGLSEMAGLSTIAVGPQLDRGRERLVVTLGIVCVTVASLVALVGTTWTFALGSLLVVLGVANITVACHTFIGARVAYVRRARAIGLLETSWAFALLVGAPLIAVLISVFGWRGPYVALALASAAVALVVARSPAIAVPSADAGALAARRDAAGVDRPAVDVAPDAAPTRPAAPTEADGAAGMLASMTTSAWFVVAGSALTALAGLSVFAISGSWLDDDFGVPTGGLGAVAMGFGAIELISSSTSAAFADRIGKLRGTVGALLLLAIGAGVMSLAGSTLWIGVVGILTFLCGFEFAIVTSFSLVSEARPSARGATIALSNGVGTVARGGGTIVGGWLYGIHGVHGTLALSATAAVLAASCFVLSSRTRRPDVAPI